MGGVAVPCHPGRPNVGLCEHYAKKPALENVIAVEVLNGGSRKGEDERAAKLDARSMAIAPSAAPIVIWSA